MMRFVIDGWRYTLLSLGNGAGLYKRPDELERVLRSPVTEANFGSVTILLREGNTGGDVFYYDEQTGDSINALGLPNLGWKTYQKLLPDLIELAKKYDKKLRISIAGFSAADYMTVVKDLVRIIVAMEAEYWVIIELNFSCPNTIDKTGHHHPVIAYDPPLIMRIINGVYKAAEGRITVAFKFSPYDSTKSVDVIVRENICKGLNKLNRTYHGDVELVLGNTIGGQNMFKPDGSPALGVTNNVGGKAGKAVKPLNLDNVRYFNSHLELSRLYKPITLVGVGGITCAQDVIDYLQAGAKKVQMTSYPAKFGEKVFGEVLDQLMERPELTETI